MGTRGSFRTLKTTNTTTKKIDVANAKPIVYEFDERMSYVDSFVLDEITDETQEEISSEDVKSTEEEEFIKT